jgi:steroid delta-isomerase-like uncharacterized protein
MPETKALTDAKVRTTIMKFLGAVNAHDVAQALEFFTEDAIWEGAGGDPPLVGHAEIRELMQTWFRGFPDLHYPLEDIELFRAFEGGPVISYWTVIMTMDGPFAGFAPTGKRAKGKGTCRYEFRDDKIARHTVIFDQMDITRQLGILPTEDSLGYRMMTGMQRLATPVARRLRKH